MKKTGLSVLLLATLASACGHKSKVDDTKAAATSTVVATPTITSAPVAATAPADFSVDSVPVSNAPLGKFPYFGWPENYAPQNTPKSTKLCSFSVLDRQGLQGCRRPDVHGYACRRPEQAVLHL